MAWLSGAFCSHLRPGTVQASITILLLVKASWKEGVARSTSCSAICVSTTATRRGRGWQEILGTAITCSTEDGMSTIFRISVR